MKKKSEIAFNDILETCEAESLSDKVYPTEESVYRYICRSYSQKFHTPLHMVMELDPEFVVRHHYDAQLDDMDLDERLDNILDTIYSLQDPEYAKQKREELAADIARYEEEEEARIAEGRPIHKAMKDEATLVPQKTVLENEKDNDKKKPTGGSISLAHFEDEDSRGGGFKE